ncbi:hypothetical protein ACJX0J_021248, partial [Zea mays]
VPQTALASFLSNKTAGRGRLKRRQAVIGGEEIAVPSTGQVKYDCVEYWVLESLLNQVTLKSQMHTASLQRRGGREQH